MKKVLVVVDMQKDFIDGALGTQEAVAIVDRVVNTIEKFDGTVMYTRDTHHENYLSTQEGKNLPVEHCIKGSAGWQFDAKIEKIRDPQDKVFEKGAFGSKDLAMYLAQENEKETIEEITLMGLCTDICVISNAMLIKAFLPEVSVKVLKDCSAGVTVESHDNALEAMKMCQIAVE